jgi:nicotinate phosphoribosyltransferase
MGMLKGLYRSSLAMLMDLYELTMAQGYWRLGLADTQAAFHMVFRQNPFGGGYAVACGLATLLEHIEHFAFCEDDLAFLATVQGTDGQPIFDGAFLDDLAALRLSVTVHAAPEGSVVFPHEPLVRVAGPLMQCQLLETAVLNLVNFPTLVATKAARICDAAGGDAVVEFGLRRAQGIDGGLTATRASYIGGCTATSNVLAGRMLNIPVAGTHAHSWVMLFDSEAKAFAAYGKVMPNNALFLVDTYDTLQGVRHAATVGRSLMAAGHKMIGIRLDSGDLAYLSVEARRILDEAGLRDAAIVATGDLDEWIIASLKQQRAAINSWGVGTRLVTAAGDGALGGVYKLTAIREAGRCEWVYKIKLSEQMVKMTTPGVLGVRRFVRDGRLVADAIYDEQLGISTPCTIIDPLDPTRQKLLDDACESYELLTKVVDAGSVVAPATTIHDARRHCRQQLAALHPTIRRLLNPHQYPCGLESRLHDLKLRLITSARKQQRERTNA